MELRTETGNHCVGFVDGGEGAAVQCGSRGGGTTAAASPGGYILPRWGAAVLRPYGALAAAGFFLRG